MEIEPGDALVVVDVQNDFCPGGALAVADGAAIIPAINHILPRFRLHVFTRDWHPANHCSFSGDPKWVDGSWPAHCVQDTPGAEFPPDLILPPDTFVISKASRADRDAYSGFEGTTLAELLRDRDITRLFVCGLATDYCVKATALDGVREGFHVALIEDACRGVDVPPGSAALAVQAMKDAGVTLCRSEELT